MRLGCHPPALPSAEEVYGGGEGGRRGGRREGARGILHSLIKQLLMSQ